MAKAKGGPAKVAPTTPAKVIIFRHKPLTLRTERESREWYEKMREYVTKNSSGELTRRITRAAEDHPEIYDFINDLGNFNPVAVQRRAEFIKSNNAKLRAKQPDGTVEELTEDQAIDAALAAVELDWQKWTRENPKAALAIHFDVGAWPMTFDAMRLGIAAIKATAISDDTTSPYLALPHDGKNADNFWLDYPMDEVAKYCNKFLGAFA